MTVSGLQLNFAKIVLCMTCRRELIAFKSDVAEMLIKKTHTQIYISITHIEIST